MGCFGLRRLYYVRDFAFRHCLDIESLAAVTGAEGQPSWQFSTRRHGIRDIDCLWQYVKGHLSSGVELKDPLEL